MARASEIPITAAQQKQRQAERVAKLVSIRDCRDCGEPIFFAKTHHGKSLPIDPDKIERYASDFIVGSDNVVHITPLVPRHHCPPMQVYRKIADVLRDHPDLQPVWDELRAAPMARDYDPDRHERALKAWHDALKARRIQMRFLEGPALGYVADTEKAGTEHPIDSDGGPRTRRIMTELDAERDGGDR